MDFAPLVEAAAIVSGVGTAACVLGNLRAAVSALGAPRLGNYAPEMPDGRDFPTLSVIVPACNEEATIERALSSLLGSDYPRLEVVLVDDRSTDGTGAVMDRMAARDPRVKVIHVDTLPTGWLGKVNALHRGTLASTGELLVYCDADVEFAPDALRRAVAWAERERLDHLTLMPSMRGSLAVQASSAAFATGFLLGIDVGAIGKPGSNTYGGVGAFGLVRRSTFERTPGFEWLKLDIADDSALAMLMVREAGGRSRLGTASSLLQLEWYPSLGALVRGLEKNLYPIIGHFSVARVLLALTMMVLIAASGWVAIALGIALHQPLLLGLAALAWLSQGLVAFAYHRVIAHPIGATLLAPIALFVLHFALARSTWATLRRGGVEWRGTLYPTELLRRSRRVDL